MTTQARRTPKQPITPSEGFLMEMNINFEKNLLIGRLGEHIVQRIFVNSGFSVSRYGYEHTAPELMEKIKNTKSPAAKFVRSAPDFLVVAPNDITNLIQVKTSVNRGKPFGKIKAGHEMYYWPEALYIYVLLDSIAPGVYVIKPEEDEVGNHFFYFNNRARCVQIEKAKEFEGYIKEETVVAITSLLKSIPPLDREQ